MTIRAAVFAAATMLQPSVNSIAWDSCKAQSNGVALVVHVEQVKFKQGNSRPLHFPTLC